MKTAVIGMGRMGRMRRTHLRMQDTLEVAAVCDISPVRDEAAVYTDWRKLLEREKPEAVFVCTYNDVIADIVCAALEAGCHVFSEKPPGRRLEETLRMAEASASAPNQVLKFGLNHRLHPSVLEAKAMLDSGQFGRVVCARGVYGKAGASDFASQWRSDQSLAGGGILLDQGIHMLDLLLYFMGDLQLVSSVVENYVWKKIPMEDNVLAIFRASDNRSALYHSSATQWRHLFRLELLCEEGYINLEGLNTTTMSYGEECIRVGYKDLEQVGGRLGMPREQIYYFTEDRSWFLELEEFADAVAGRRPVAHGTIDDAVRLMRLVGDIYSK